jgi:membrane protease YdiL (CAAX protease family)
VNQNQLAYPSFPQALLIFVIFLAASTGIGLLIGAVNGLAGIDNLSPGNFIGYNVSMLFVIWFARRNRMQHGNGALRFGRIPSLLYPLLILLTVSLSVVLDPLTSLIPMSDFFKRLFAMLATRDIWTFLMVGITGPVLEEVLFRGIILEGFLTRYRPFPSIVLSALLFGLFHMNPWQFIPGFLIGLLLGYIYLKTRSLIPVILVHMVNNSFSYLIMYIYGADVESFRDLFADPEYYYLLLAFSIVVFASLLLILYKYLTRPSGPWTSA